MSFLRCRSTKLYLDEPLDHSGRTRQARLDALNHPTEHNYCPVVPPESYVDFTTNKLMDNPCDIGVVITRKLGENNRVTFDVTKLDEPVYVDKSASRLATNPMTRERWTEYWSYNLYPIDVDLQKRIETWLRIEEIRRLVNNSARKRQLALKEEFPSFEHREKLFATAKNVLKVTGRAEEIIPEEFKSKLSGEIMSLPVFLDNGDIIDFHELFKTTDSIISANPYEKALKDYYAFVKEGSSDIAKRRQDEIINLSLLPVMPEEEAKRLLDEVQKIYERSMAAHQQITLEKYIEQHDLDGMKEALKNYRSIYQRNIEQMKAEFASAQASLDMVQNEHKALIQALEQNTLDRRLIVKRIEALKSTKLCDAAQSITAAEEEIKEIDKKSQLHENELKDFDARLLERERRLAAAEIKLKSYEEKSTFEDYVRKKSLSPEYINPCTRQPLRFIKIDYELLKKIDNWIDPLAEEIRVLEKHVQDYKPALTGKSYAETVKERIASGKFPEDKIPDLVCAARIPGKEHFEIPTNPVLLDGTDIIDYSRLKEYWESKNIFYRFVSLVYPLSWHGYNPFTGKPCKSVQYHHPLKQEVDFFMHTALNAPALISKKNAQNPNRHYYPFLFKKPIKEALEEQIKSGFAANHHAKN